MKKLYLSEEFVLATLPMSKAVELVEGAFRCLADGTAINHPRRRVVLPTGSVLHYMPAGMPQYFGIKVYSTNPKSGAHFEVLLYRSEDGMPLATFEANHLGQIRTGAASGGTRVTFGEFGIQALEHAYITNRQIEAARIAMTRHIRRGGKVWINIYPDRPLTKKPAETRMGSGKGSPEWWIANVKPGRVMFELSGVEEPVAREALRRAIHKLPIKCKIVKRELGEA